MGMCVSCEATSMATAKVILQDGTLQEFSHPIKVSYILAKDPHTFLCNSEDMEFDDVVSAVHNDAELEPGQLYFVLPVSKLRRPLPPEEMASLAVKANAALLKRVGNDKCRCHKKKVGFFGEERSEKVAAGTVSPAPARRSRNRSLNGNRRLRVFNANLSTIVE